MRFRFGRTPIVATPACRTVERAGVCLSWVDYGRLVPGESLETIDNSAPHESNLKLSLPFVIHAHCVPLCRIDRIGKDDPSRGRLITGSID
jgi:hypothetical protein